jgi:beta-fructofuranosidase
MTNPFRNGRKIMKKACATLSFLLILASLPAWSSERLSIMNSATAYWTLGELGNTAKTPLTPTGPVEFGKGAPGADDKAPNASLATLNEAFFNAGADLPISGNNITVYLRARDPKGVWSYGLFSKRGGHDIVTFNLFSIDLGGTDGPDIGFELHSQTGFIMVSFPVSQIDPTAWHDFVGRYDGRSVEIICDGKVMAKHRWRGGDLTHNSEPILIGAETDNGQIVRKFTGEMQEAAIWPRALRYEDLATVMNVNEITPNSEYVEPYSSPIHYRPDVGRLADTIPFYHNGEYHIFYLRAIDKVPWEHIVSENLIQWKELLTALVADGKEDGPDGLNMFTGSVTEKGGEYHIFYTGWNPKNPEGREWIMHATSPDLVKWTKHPELGFRGDDVHYQNSDFRDPYVFWNSEEKRYWMILCARDAKTGKPVQGVATSDDLMKWEQTDPLTLDPPLGDGTPECPDLFKIGDKFYLLHSPMTNTTNMRYSDNIRGPYHVPPAESIDTPLLYAAKRMFDGKRHVITGWIRDLHGDVDDGAFEWGGDQSVPREVYPGENGQLLFRPVPEATAAFPNTVLELANRPTFKTSGDAWKYADNGLIGAPGDANAQCVFDMADNYMMLCKLQLEPLATFTMTMRGQEAADSGYRLILRPEKQEVEIAGAKFSYPRKIAFDTVKPITVQAFVQGSIIECFVNNAYAFSCRAYDMRRGTLNMKVEGGKATVQRLTVRTTQQ